MAEQYSLVILGERLLIHTISCATLIFEKRYVYNCEEKRDSHDSLNFIINNSGLHMIIETFNLHYDGHKLTHHFVYKLCDCYGNKARDLIKHSSIATIIPENV